MRYYIVETEDGDRIGPMSQSEAALLVEEDDAQKARMFPLTPYEPTRPADRGNVAASAAAGVAFC
jgi:hypothetical protein